MASRALPFFVLGAGVLIVSIAAILIRYAQAGGAPSLGIAAMRLTVAAAVLAPFAWWSAGRELRCLAPRALGLCVFSGGLLAVHFWAWITSLEYTSVASSTALVTTNPLWVALLSAILLRERPGIKAIGGIALTLAGGVLVFAGDANRNPASAAMSGVGNGLALLGAVAASGYLLVGRALRARISLIAYVWLAYTAAAGFLIVAAVGTGASVMAVSVSSWICMIALGLGPQLLGHTAFNWSLRRLTATFVAVAILGEPIGSALLAYLLLDEHFSTLQFAGFVMLLSGIFVAARDENRRTSSGKPGANRSS